jgi:hypothetical protein
VRRHRAGAGDPRCLRGDVRRRFCRKGAISRCGWLSAPVRPRSWRAYCATGFASPPREPPAA